MEIEALFIVLLFIFVFALGLFIGYLTGFGSGRIENNNP